MPTLLLRWQSVDTAAANQSAFLQGWKREKETQICLVECTDLQQFAGFFFSADEMECRTPSAGLSRLTQSRATCPQ